MCSDSQTILVVDDIPGFRTVQIDMLKDFGFSSFIEANDGKEALEKIAEIVPILIISDYMMSPMSGLGLLDSVRKSPNNHDIPFIIITAAGDTEVLAEAKQLGVTGFLNKPISYTSFKDTVLSAVMGKMR